MNPIEDGWRIKIRWLLVLVTVIVYWPVSFADFINYDDKAFVYGNPHVYSGLTSENVAWAFGTLNGGTAYYQPLTWLTHQLDCHLFGLNPGPHHLTNLWLHIANVLLLFKLLDKVTERIWRSAVVATLFGLHPLHVETVAWISERKSLVCTFFWLLATLVYIRYVNQGGLKHYLLMMILYAAALLSKPLAVSLPFTLVLLDYWPLARFRSCRQQVSEVGDSLELNHIGPFANNTFPCGRRFARVFVLSIGEKVPLFVLSVLACAITIIAQADLGATKSLQEVPLEVRLNNSLVVSVSYLRKGFWPLDLAPIYPLRHDWPWWQIGICALVLLSISVHSLRLSASRPYLLVGWCWYLVTLLPTLGFVQVGLQGMADRYAYIPLIGVFVMVVWSVSDRFDKVKVSRLTLGTLAAALLAMCALATSMILPYWHDSFSLFQRAIKVTGKNYVADRQLGLAFNGVGRYSEAESSFRESLRIQPKQAVTEMFLGEALSHEGDSKGAFEHYSRALTLKSADAQVHGRLAQLFMHSKDPAFHDPLRALGQARLACELSHYRKRDLLIVLVEACVENHRVSAAIDAGQMVLAVSIGPKEIQGAQKLLTDVREALAMRNDAIPPKISEIK